MQVAIILCRGDTGARATQPVERPLGASGRSHPSRNPAPESATSPPIHFFGAIVYSHRPQSPRQNTAITPRNCLGCEPPLTLRTNPGIQTGLRPAKSSLGASHHSHRTRDPTQEPAITPPNLFRCECPLTPKPEFSTGTSSQPVNPPSVRATTHTELEIQRGNPPSPHQTALSASYHSHLEQSQVSKPASGQPNHS